MTTRLGPEEFHDHREARSRWSLNGKPNSQQSGCWLVWPQDDFYRQALHDLGEVAGGVVRLQRRERCTRRSRNVHHLAIKVDVVGVNSNIDFAWIGNGYLGPIPWLVIIALVTIAVSAFILHGTVLGVHVYAVGGNPQAARLTGIPVSRVLIFVYGVSGVLSGLAGAMSASRLYSAQGQLGIGYELDAIAAAILGGTSFSGGIGTVFGTLIGALIIAVLNNGLTLLNVSFYWQLVIKGAVIVLAVTLDKLRARGQPT
jgi:ribose transport system permease protein